MQWKRNTKHSLVPQTIHSFSESKGTFTLPPLYQVITKLLGEFRMHFSSVPQATEQPETWRMNR